MKTALAPILMLIAISLPVFAQDLPDVPLNHWAYQAVGELVSAGIVQPYPDGTFSGNHAMSRYEFAAALVKAIPEIQRRVQSVPRLTGPAGPPGPPGPQGPPGSAAEFNALRDLVNEFPNELEALGADIEPLRRDVAALKDRVAGAEDEIGRVRFYGIFDPIARGEVANTGTPSDRDSRVLSDRTSGTGDQDNPLANSRWFNNLDLGMSARVSRSANLNAQFMIGNYMDYALDPSGDVSEDIQLPEFLLWSLNADLAATLGPLGPTQIVAGRYGFQLTPLTMEFVDTDSYTDVPALDGGDYIMDGARASFNVGKVGVTAFGAKTGVIGGQRSLDVPALTIPGFDTEIATTQFAGIRAVIGSPLAGNLGVTWYDAGLEGGFGRMRVYGADVSTTLSRVAVTAEYARNSPNDQLEASLPGTNIGDDNSAWRAGLACSTAKLGLGLTYTSVQANYTAPGYWLRAGRAVNLQNVKGFTANISHAFGNRLSFHTEAQIFQPDNDGVPVTARTAVEASNEVTAVGLDDIVYLRGGVRFGLGRSAALTLDWEDVRWDSTASGSTDTRERYVTYGMEHAIGTSASLRLLYQTVSYVAGTMDPYNEGRDERGGVAMAQLNIRF